MPNPTAAPHPIEHGRLPLQTRGLVGGHLHPVSLQTVHLLHGMGEAVLTDVASVTRLRQVRARQQVIGRDDLDRDCYFVLSGRLRVVAWSATGRELSFRDVGCGETFGELAALDGRPRSASVMALSDGMLAQIGPDDLRALMQRHWCITERLLQHLAGTARVLTDRLYELGLLGVTQRLAAELLRQAATCDDGVLDPEPRHGDLAARIGTVREQVSRAMADLEQRGLVRRDRQRLTLPDTAALAAWADGPARGVPASARPPEGSIAGHIS